jgi:hypothetical protein
MAEEIRIDVKTVNGQKFPVKMKKDATCSDLANEVKKATGH